MRLGKHVYGQKPLAHDLYEVRQLAEFAAQRSWSPKWASRSMRRAHYHGAVLLIQAGAIGKVKEVHSWCPKSWGDPTPRPDA